MDSLFENYKQRGSLHHVYVIEGVYDLILPNLISHIEKYMDISVIGNPNVFVEQYQSFGINESRRLKILQSRTNWEVKSEKLKTKIGWNENIRKFFIIGTDSMTHEAQNALLKIFEEPTEGTHFFIILPHIDILLLTLRSRVSIVPTKNTNYELPTTNFSNDEAYMFANKFLNACLEDQFVLIKQKAKKIDDTSIEREFFRRVLNSIEKILYGKLEIYSVSAVPILKEIYQAKMYLTFPGSSPKMLLEHIAIVLISHN